MATSYSSTVRSYVGKGQIYLAKYTGGALRPIGNVSSFTSESAEEKKEEPEFRYAGGGIRNSIVRIGAVTGKISVYDYTPENIAIATRSSSTDVTSATVTDEAHDNVYAGSLVMTNFLYSPSVDPVVKKGETTLTKDTDYTLVPSGIQLLTGGAVADSDDITISYTKNKSVVLQGLVESQKEYKLVFDGLNEADSGNPVVVKIHRAKFSPSSLNWIGDDFAQLELSFDMLSDSAITGTGLSKFFTVTMVG